MTSLFRALLHSGPQGSTSLPGEDCGFWASVALPTYFPLFYDLLMSAKAWLLPGLFSGSFQAWHVKVPRDAELQHRRRGQLQGRDRSLAGALL